jgi:hypothetical protein
LRADHSMMDYFIKMVIANSGNFGAINFKSQMMYQCMYLKVDTLKFMTTKQTYMIVGNELNKFNHCQKSVLSKERPAIIFIKDFNVYFIEIYYSKIAQTWVVWLNSINNRKIIVKGKSQYLYL